VDEDVEPQASGSAFRSPLLSSAVRRAEASGGEGAADEWTARLAAADAVFASLRAAAVAVPSALHEVYFAAVACLQ
jgi:hypothetical protein